MTASPHQLRGAAREAGLLRGLGAMQAVFQFDHGNGRERDFGLAVLAFECCQQFAYRSGVTLAGDQYPGVQD